MLQPLISLASLPSAALSAFIHEDVKLFELRDEIMKDLGEKVDFYSWLGVKKNAKGRAIQKAFRKISRRLHPDRNPGKEATDRFARLNEVYKILRSPVRERYDHYLSKGFPSFDAVSGEWKFSHFRPNLILTVIFVALIVSFIHFLVLKAQAYSRKNQLKNIAEDARRESARATPTGVITTPVRVQNGANEFTVHPTDEVYFAGVKVDPSAVEEPTWKDTILVQLYYKLANGKTEQPRKQSEEYVEITESEVPKEPAQDKKEEKKDTLSKGAARRRPAGARGKAKIF